MDSRGGPLRGNRLIWCISASNLIKEAYICTVAVRILWICRTTWRSASVCKKNVILLSSWRLVSVLSSHKFWHFPPNRITGHLYAHSPGGQPRQRRRSKLTARNSRIYGLPFVVPSSHLRTGWWENTTTSWISALAHINLQFLLLLRNIASVQL